MNDDDHGRHDEPGRSDLLAGALDLHVHTAPDVVGRWGTDAQTATAARRAGFAGIVLKCHHESTVGRAAAAATATGLEVHGGLVLNAFVSGGVRPEPVEASLRLGGRIVWWPTLSAAAHRTYYEGVPTEEPAVDHGVVREICALVAAHGAVLATGHAGPSTVLELAEVTAQEGARMLVTHADFWIPDLPVDVQADLAQAHPHVVFERCAYVCEPAGPDPRPLEPVAEAIARTGGAGRNVISSDLGQPAPMPTPVDGLRRFAQRLIDAGIARDEVRTMLTATPRTTLLGPPARPTLA